MPAEPVELIKWFVCAGIGCGGGIVAAIAVLAIGLWLLNQLGF